MDDPAATFDAHVEPMSPAEHVEALTPVPLRQIATGFWAFKTLAAAHELDLFTRLAGGAETTAQQLARELARSPRRRRAPPQGRPTRAAAALHRLAAHPRRRWSSTTRFRIRLMAGV
jgi:hypothetical protein